MGFGEGHQLSVRHGAYAVVALAGRAGELAEGLRERLPLFDERVDGTALATYALLLARLERAHERLAVAERDGDEERCVRLAQNARGWHRLALAYEDRFGLSPLSRARLAGSIAAAREGSLADYIEQAYGEGDGGGDGG